MNFEKQIERISSKSALIAMIEKAPDDALMFVVMFKPTTDTVSSYMFPSNMSTIESIGLNDLVARYCERSRRPLV